jgi:serine/threonine protein kinase/uncharacterized small protein (DUF1192 family)
MSSLYDSAWDVSEIEMSLEKDPGKILSAIEAEPPLAEKKSKVHSTLLLSACKMQAPLALVQKLLDFYPKAAEIPNSDSFLPLHVACANKADAKIVQLLVQSYREGLEKRNRHNNLPIHTACANMASIDVIKLLVKEYPGCLIVKGMFDHAPLQTVLSSGYPLERHSWALEASSFILSQCPTSSSFKDQKNNLPLHLACRLGNLEVITLILTSFSQGIQERGSFGQTPLHKACDKGASKDVISLLYYQYEGAIRTRDTHNALPLHMACIGKAPTETILFLISAYPGALLVNSAYGLPQYRVEGWNVTNDIAFLTNIFHSIQSGDLEAKNVWVHEIINNGEILRPALEHLLNENPSYLELAYLTTDNLGRKTLDAAPVSIKETFRSRLFLCGIYEILPGKPEHVSSTSIVYFANDYSQQENDSQPTRVAIKFMRKKEQFLREKETRQHLEKHFATSGVLSSSGTLPILASFDGETDIAIATQLQARGFATNPFILVLPAADRSLRIIVESESGGEIAKEGDTDESTTKLQKSLPTSWTEEVIRAIKQIAEALADLHAAGLVHGDVKPRNIVRVDSHYKLIDMDAAVHVGEPAGLKLSTAYIAPEIALSLPDDHAFPPTTLSSPSISISAGYFVSDVVASPSLDAWSLGVTLYHMMARQSLFHADDFDNLALSTDLNVLRQWSDKEKIERLSRINNREARHLLSLLLYRDPLKRPSMQKVLSHAFLTGMQPKRLPDEPAKFDVFISYRKASDSDHVKALADSLVKSGLRVWWDENLTPGQNWLSNFCEALSSSRMFVPIVSRGAVNAVEESSGKPIIRQNWSNLTADSDHDNVLLEWRLACELREQGLMEGAVPVYFGDFDKQAGVYGNFFDQKCGPSCPDATVEAVEDTLREQLAELGLGEPLTFKIASVKDTWNKTTVHQGVITRGSLEEVIKQATNKIYISLETEENASITANTLQHRGNELLIRELRERIALLEKEIKELRRSYSSNSSGRGASSAPTLR